MSYSPASTARSDSGRIALGSIQISASLLAGFLWLALGIGVAMCGDSGRVARCDHIFSLWRLTGLTALLSMVGGAALMIGSRAADGSSWRTATGWFAAVTAAALVVAGTAFWVVSSQPLN